MIRDFYTLISNPAFNLDLIDKQIKKINDANDICRVWATRCYNPEEFDLVPKRSYTEKLIKEKEQRLLSLGERRKNINRQLNEEEKALKLEIDQLKQKLNK